MAPRAEPRQEPDAGVGCSLSSAELADRVSDWRSLYADALIRETVRDGVAVAVLARSAEVMRRLQALIEAEGSCCPFLDFRVHEEDNVVTVEVRSSASDAEDTVLTASGAQTARRRC
jgi:MerR family transcriptional regulator, copper efflux regulator